MNSTFLSKTNVSIQNTTNVQKHIDINQVKIIRNAFQIDVKRGPNI